MTLFKTCDKLQGMYYYSCFKDVPRGSEGKESTCIAGCEAGDPSSTPGLGRSPAKGNGNPLQYSCLETPMDRGTWWAIVHRAAKNWTGLK